MGRLRSVLCMNLRFYFFYFFYFWFLVNCLLYVHYITNLMFLYVGLGEKPHISIIPFLLFLALKSCRKAWPYILHTYIHTYVYFRKEFLF